MEVSLKSTTKIVELLVDGVAIPARIWCGYTASGVACHAYITRIAVARDQDSSEFEADLKEHAAPTPDVAAIPLRMIL
jgi:hypothetical protein